MKGICAACGTEFEAYPSEFKKGRRFCSWACRDPRANGRHTPAIERFHALCTPDPNSGCWLWIGHIQKAGYGTFAPAGRTILAHRYAYEILVGPVPLGLDLDHLCRVRRCVNPKHLEPVTRLVNVQRGLIGTATCCRNGHPYTDVYVTSQGTRICRICRRKTDAARRRRDPGRAEKWRLAIGTVRAPGRG